ncbi:uncharacterized protein LOC134825457 [Bolinopsis microptera]|uniref:uncharacterized protein LOC134825457 n=1 Tax=Bolinopsis microptera TaxID=2820187 RepID=UPI0030793A3B
MLCFLILFLPELALSQTFGSVELTSSATAVFQEPVTPEPTVTNWGVWGETCQYNSIMTACQKSRERFCTVVVNSTRSCSETLQDFTDCPDDQCDRWSDWEQWSQCAQPVDDRLSCNKERERHCLLSGKLCAGENMEVSDCGRQHCAPKFKSHGRQVSRISYRRSFLLVCDVEPSRTVGYQGMEVMWKRDPHYILSDLTRADPDTLRYQDELTEHETGIYTCCVRNEFGTRCRDNWDVKLSDHGPVRSKDRVVDDLLRFTVERGKNITLHCYLEGYKLEYRWFRGDGEGRNITIVKGERLQSLQITNMSKDKQGNYSCCAFDFEFGNSLFSQGYEISESENTQRKYLIITITVISLLIVILGLVLYITWYYKLLAPKPPPISTIPRRHNNVVFTPDIDDDDASGVYEDPDNMLYEELPDGPGYMQMAEPNCKGNCRVCFVLKTRGPPLYL